MTIFPCGGCMKRCALTVDEDNDYEVSGFSCATGQHYGRMHGRNPVTYVVSYIRLEDGKNTCTVKTDKLVPLKKVPEIKKLIKEVKLSAPVHYGDIILENVADTSANVFATKNIR